MDEQVAYRLGRGFARVISELEETPVDQLRLGLGRDMRLSAPEMAKEYAHGMVDEGAHVIDVGQVGTEQLYYLVGSQDLHGGVMCTASPYPAGYNGAEAVRPGGLALLGDAVIPELRDILGHGQPEAPCA